MDFFKKSFFSRQKNKKYFENLKTIESITTISKQSNCKTNSNLSLNLENQTGNSSQQNQKTPKTFDNDSQLKKNEPKPLNCFKKVN